ncbi:MAG: CcoQ/FixQ family Cbb3-type cytochrome c oxidase assembly chaperone [Sphingobacteriales bacterium]|nr:MAG: CcoQ/FixQ family Cbb3-type cytochrome c oxidase assembly chaperone [Sphingobacteriales bacterium]
MYKNILKAVEGIEIFPLVSLAIFFIFFVGLSVYVFTSRKEYIKMMSQIPLQNENECVETEEEYRS